MHQHLQENQWPDYKIEDKLGTSLWASNYAAIDNKYKISNFVFKLLNKMFHHWITKKQKQKNI